LNFKKEASGVNPRRFIKMKLRMSKKEEEQNGNFKNICEQMI